MTGKQTKAQKTREHILETALGLFASKGYDETTMRDIAAAAECSLGLAYRYFARKEEMVLELYEQCARELEKEVSRLPAGPMAARFVQAIEADLRGLAPHRVTMGALFSAGLAPNSEVAVLGDRVAGIRSRVCGIFGTVISGATDAPKPAQAAHLATLFYAAHLLIVLFWLQDRSTGQAKTAELLRFARETLGRLRPLLGLPPVAKPLARLAGIVGPMFGPPQSASSGGGADGDGNGSPGSAPSGAAG